ncbi:hypothetical protein Droror1_Dr00002940 [Drosera rotundifolia]
MGNVQGREDAATAGEDVEAIGGRSEVEESMGNYSPPGRPARPRSPFLFAPELPVAPLRSNDGAPFFNQSRQNDSHGVGYSRPVKGIPTLITWSHGGNNVAVEGSWDNWTTRRFLHRSGKDHTLLLVLPSGIYHYKFIIDGESRYMPDLPSVTDDSGQSYNVLDVNDYVPESLESVVEFEAPPSPDSSYGQVFPPEDEFAKAPVMIPPQVEVSVLGTPDSDVASARARPQHVVLNHLFIEKGWATSQSVVALGLTHRFQSKYVTVTLYKPLKR